MGRTARWLWLILCCAPSAAVGGLWVVHTDGTATDPNGQIVADCSLKKLIEDQMLQPGDTVVIDSGTYNASSIFWPWRMAGRPDQPIIIRGSGDVNDPNTFPLFDFAGTTGTDDYWMRFRDNAYIQIEKLRIDHISRPILFDTDPNWNGAHDMTFNYLVITWAGIPGQNSMGRAFEFQEPAADYVGWMPQYNITIKNTTIQHVSEVGIKCHGRAHDIKIENVTIDDVDNGRDDTTADGICFTVDKWGAPSNITLSNVRVSNVRADGIDIKGYGIITLRDCEVYNCGADGIKLWAPNINGWFSQAYFKLRDVRVYNVSQVGLEAFHMPNLDMERCSFSGAEQGFLYKWWAKSDEPSEQVPWWGWSANFRSYRNAFATTSGGPACEIVKSHTTANGCTAVMTVDPNSINNDSFWCWYRRGDDTIGDPRSSGATERNGAGIALAMYEYGQRDAEYMVSLDEIATGGPFRKLGVEWSASNGKHTPPYSPAADFNCDGAVDGLDFLAWQSGFPLAGGGNKRSGDATADGAVDGLDFLAWQSWFPFCIADFDHSGTTDAKDYFTWLGAYVNGTGTTLAEGDADGNGKVEWADFQVWRAQMLPNFSPPGDFNSDGIVDYGDWLIWQTNWSHWAGGGATKAHGDGDGDGIVDGLDLVVWQSWFPYPPVRKPEPDTPPILPPRP